MLLRTWRQQLTRSYFERKAEIKLDKMHVKQFLILNLFSNFRFIEMQSRRKHKRAIVYAHFVQKRNTFGYIKCWADVFHSRIYK